jgi:hypothetical protein
MRLRAEQIRPGHRVRGYDVVGVRASLNSGTVRITVAPRTPTSGAAGATLTFCYQCGEVLDEENGVVSRDDSGKA